MRTTVWSAALVAVALVLGCRADAEGGGGPGNGVPLPPRSSSHGTELPTTSAQGNPLLELVADPSLPAPLNRVRLPRGFHIRYWASQVPDARSMTLGANGTVFVGTRRLHVVYALQDRGRSGRADTNRTIVDGLREPNGVAFHNGSLYIAAVSNVYRLDNLEARLGNPPKPVLVCDTFPRDTGHGWRYIAFGPDGWLYIPVGAPCNVCLQDNPIYASIARIKPDGSDRQILAHGVRNTVGFDWHPTTGQLWFTENGRDYLGDDVPPDELNVLTRAGEHFGFPFVHGRDLLDPQFGRGHRPDEFTPPQVELPPHAAALGMKFYTGRMFPPEYRNQVFIAEHGSWNRSEPSGYQVELVRFGADGKPVGHVPFAVGFNPTGRAWGRPVDLLQLPDGSLLLSDDQAGAIYRITYDGKGPGR